MSRPERNKDDLKFGWVSVESLKFRTDAPKQKLASGFDRFLQEDMSFEDLPTDAPKSIVRILPSSQHWWEISPDDRWIAGNGDVETDSDDLQLFDTAVTKSHMIPGLGDSPRLAFSKDSSLLAIFEDGDAQVWNVAGNSPFMVATTAGLSKEQKKELRPIFSGGPYGACSVTQDSVAITNENGSARLQLNGPDLQLVSKSDLAADHASYSGDGNALAVWKDNGAIWQYEWNGTDWKGKSKTRVPAYAPRTHGRARMQAMGSTATNLMIYTSGGLTIWNDLTNQKSNPITTIGQSTNALGFDISMDCVAVSENQQWIVSIKELDNACKLTLLNRDLKTLKTHDLPFRFSTYDERGSLLVTNDGQHALVRDSERRTFVIRL